MSYLDSHCHLNDEAFLEDYEEAIKRALDNGVRFLCVVGWDVESSKKAVEIAKKHSGVYAMVGIHPENLEGISENSITELSELAKEKEVIAIGEIGLDYHWFKEPEEHENQKAWFKRQIALANELHLPISIHARDASQDTLNILKENVPQYGGVLHCYSASPEMLPEFAKLGMYFGFDGPITFKNSKAPKEAVRVCPDDRILSETDCPYMAPTPNRGKRNEPAYIPLIVEEMARIKEKSLEEMEQIIEENFKRLFHVKQLMKHFDPILVVEGASDKAFISTFLEADFVITNGSEVSRETIEYLKEAKKTRDIVVLTDPDSPGKRIRDILDQNIPGLLHAFVPKEHSIKHHKVGVAESTEFDVMNALSHIIPSKAVKKGDLTLADFYDLGLSGTPDSKANRDKVAKKLHLGFGNAKTLLQRANALGISKEQIEEALQ